jgi:hypothetical protein
MFFFGLKGQSAGWRTAQGKVEGGTNRNDALGKGYRRKTVRVDSMIKAKNPFGRN